MRDAGIDTPALLIDRRIMETNIRRMADQARTLGVALRPHAKTHKLPEVALEQIGAGAVGITAAKLGEAEVMADGGVADIFVAYPIVGPVKAERAVRLAGRIDRLIVGVDSREGGAGLAEAAVRGGTELEVRLEIDTGLRRTGVPMEKAVGLAKELAAMKGLRLTGIYTFRGAMLQGKSTLDLERAGAEEGELMATLAESIRSAGVPVMEVSVGSTPTAVFAGRVNGVTEIRPGTYVFNDRMQARFGVCGEEDCAGSVLVTVVSRPYPDLLVIDGGSKTFATDVQPGTDPLRLSGFGRVEGYPHAVFERMNEEHGMIRIRDSDELKVGDKLRIVPNHICSTINLHNDVYMVDGDSVRRVPVAARGRLN